MQLGFLSYVGNKMEQVLLMEKEVFGGRPQTIEHRNWLQEGISPEQCISGLLWGRCAMRSAGNS